MERFRHIVAVVLVCASPLWFLYWPLLHGFLPHWRKLGWKRTRRILWTVLALVACGLFLLRDQLVTGYYGRQPPLAIAGLVLMVVAVRMRRRIRRHISGDILAGEPELEPDLHARVLVQSGPYARVRHPRYVQMTVTLLAWALVVNHLTVYLLWLLWIPTMVVIVLLEERELRQRFGDAYLAYCRNVPRLIPRRPA